MAKSDKGIFVAAVAGATALVVGMGLVDASTPTRTTAAGQRQMPRAVVREKTREAGELKPFPLGDPVRIREYVRESGTENEGEGEGDRPGQPGEPLNEVTGGPSATQVDMRAYPRGYVSARRATVARRAYANLPERLTKTDFRKTVPNKAARAQLASNWNAKGPSDPYVPAETTYTNSATTYSGRVTAMVIASTCAPGDCRLWVAAAGGGIWRTEDALAETPQWEPLDNGLTSNTFGSLALDPSDPTESTIYAGSGEPSGSGDSEAGVGLFKSTDGGDTWVLMPGSVPVAKDRSIAAILIDPTNPSTIRIGTALARHGLSSVAGGRRTPPGAPTMGIYLSKDAGDSFTLEFSEPGDGVPPATGNDYFTGGVRRLMYDPDHADEIYATIQGYGIYRKGNALDADPSTFNQVYRGEFAIDNFGNYAPDPDGAMIDFDLAKVTGNTTRLYVGDTSDFYNMAVLRVADGIDGTGNEVLLDAEKTDYAAPWELRSSDKITDPEGYSSFYWCQNGQCVYDSFVKADPSDPSGDTVWMGGAMNYGELYRFGEPPVSNGRAVIRSTDAGKSFTDMTNDSGSPPQGMHPDQHALVFNPDNPAQVFVGSDGGVVRTDGTYVDGSGDCATRKDLAGTPLDPDQVKFCQAVLKEIPQRIDSLNKGLNTLQFQSLSLNAQQPYTDVIGGTQDNGTWGRDGEQWFMSVGGDGGQSGISPEVNSRMHTYYGTAGDVNFNGNDVLGWNYVTGPIDYSGEGSSFYTPLIADPVAAGTYFMGAESVWRTQNSGGDPAQLQNQCNEMSGTGPFDETCGDFQPLGVALAPTPDDFIVALARSSADTSTMWIGLRYGELFVSSNIDAPRTKVGYDQLDTSDMPGRFVSGIAVDPMDSNHAWISYSGYSAYTPDQPGHVFEAWWNPQQGEATFEDRSLDLGDQPVTGIAVDWPTGDVYASTDFGVARLPAGATSWAKAAEGLPPVATYGLTMDPAARVLYAATHGRGAYDLPLDPAAVITGPDIGQVGVPMQFDSASSAGFQGIRSVDWTLPDGTHSSEPAISWIPDVSGDVRVQLAVTDSLGHVKTTTAQVPVNQGPAPALVPKFAKKSKAKRTATSVSIKITNYTSGATWTATSTKGKATVTGKGRVKVTDLKAGHKVKATVTASRDGSEPGVASIGLQASKMCSLTVKAKGQKFRLPRYGSTTVVRKASSAKCRLSPAKVAVTPRGKQQSVSVGVRKLAKGRVEIETVGVPVKVTVRYVAKPKSDAYARSRWTRTWSTR